MDDKLVRLSDVINFIKTSGWVDYPPHAEGMAEELTELIPAVDAVEVRHGRWLRTPTSWVYCSVCGEEPPQETNITSDFCPNCGAKMDGEEEHNAAD